MMLRMGEFVEVVWLSGSLGGGKRREEGPGLGGTVYHKEIGSSLTPPSTLPPSSDK